MARNWYQRPVLVFFVFLSLCLIMAFAARNMELGQSSSSSYHLFSVEFDYFGMDAESLESLLLWFTGMAMLKTLSFPAPVAAEERILGFCTPWGKSRYRVSTLSRSHKYTFFCFSVG